MTDISQLVAGRSFLEGPRWHDGALYVSDMHGDAVLRITTDGVVTTVVEVEQPSGLGWLPDGSLLISSMTARAVMRFDGTALTTHADVSAFAEHEINDTPVTVPTSPFARSRESSGMSIVTVVESAMPRI